MGEYSGTRAELPKNIRQIGERDEVVRLYVEDYVNTYLKQVYPSGGPGLRVGLLLGSSDPQQEVPCLFVDGALEMEEVVPSGEKIVFSEAAWKKAYQRMEETFPKKTVQGWFICGAPGSMISPLTYWRLHKQYFGGKNQLMYINSGVDGEAAYYVMSEDGFYRLKGYHIYYEKNQMMQDYMILRKDARRVETGTGDRVIRDFRNRMEERQREAASRYGTIRALGTLCGVLSVAVLAGGVVLFGNYQKMREMESVLVSVLPEGVRGVAGTDGKEAVTVEQIRGSVTPLESSGTGTDVDVTGNTANAAETGGQTHKWMLESAADIGVAGAATAGGQAGQKTSAPSGQSAEAGTAGTGQAAENSAAAVSSGRVSASPRNRPQETGTAGRSAGDSQTQAETKAPYILPEPEAQRDLPNPGGNSTAGQDYPVTNLKPGGTYTVGNGETLYGICFKLYGNIRHLDDIMALNHLTDENRIIAGQTLVLPDVSGES